MVVENQEMVMEKSWNIILSSLWEPWIIIRKIHARDSDNHLKCLQESSFWLLKPADSHVWHVHSIKKHSRRQNPS